MKLTNIEDLIRGNGQVCLGQIGPINDAAVASEGSQTLAMLVRRKGESLADLLQRLNEAIGRAWEEGQFVDEING